MLTKTFKLKLDEVSDEAEKGVFTGYASTFGNEDIVGDVFDRGAFKRTAKAKGRGLPILLSHLKEHQLGVNLEMEEDEYGLFVKGELMVDDISKAREQYAIIKRSAELGRAMGLSVGFRVIPGKEKWVETEDGRRLRHFKEVELYEYSVTPFAANTQADIIDVRSGDPIPGSTVQEMYNLVRRIKDAGYENDPVQLDLIKATITKLQALVPDDNDVTKDDPPDDASDPAEGHSLLLADLRSFKEQLAGVGNYGNRDT